MEIIKLILLIKISIATVAYFKVEEPDNNLNSNLLTEIMKKNFLLSTTVIISEQKAKSINVNHLISGVIHLDLAHLHVLQSLTIKSNHFVLTYYNEDIQSLNKTISYLKTCYCFDSRAKYLIIARSFEDVDAIVNILWRFRLYKSVIILGNDMFGIDLYESNCGTVIKAVKIYNGLFEPDMKKFFHNCTLKVIYSSFAPWISENASGIFAEALNIFAESNKFHLVYLPENPIYGEELQVSYSFESVKNDFENGYADIFLGLGNNLPYLIVETTMTVYDDNLYWVVPKAQRMPYWKAMIKYFPIYYWISWLIFFVTSCVVFNYVANKSRQQDAVKNCLMMFAIALNFSIGALPTRTILRFLIMVYICISFLTCVVLQAKLYDIFSNPVYENDVTDVDKLLESGLPMKFPVGLSIVFLFTGPQNQRVFESYTSTNLTLMESMDELIKTKNFATIIDTGILVMRPNTKERFNIFEIVYFQTCFYMKKHHELFDVFNFAIKRIVESGFVNKLVSDTRWEYYLKDKSGGLHEEGFFRLSLVHFQGAFFLLINGMLAAFFIFLIELITKLLKNY